MDLKRLAYAAVCVIGLSYLLFANAQGYVPFASNPTHPSFGTANHFHK